MGFYLSVPFSFQKLLMVLYFNYLYSLCWSFRTCLYCFTKARFWGMKHSYDIWLRSGTELYGRSENISDRFCLHIWYLHERYVWPLESRFPWYFAASWTERKTQQKADPPLLLFWWSVCERPRILNLNEVHSVYSLIQVSKQFWRQ